MTFTVHEGCQQLLALWATAILMILGAAAGNHCINASRQPEGTLKRAWYDTRNLDRMCCCSTSWFPAQDGASQSSTLYRTSSQSGWDPQP